MRLNWKKIWNDLDEWVVKFEEASKCGHCKRKYSDFPTWNDQQDKIEELVKAQISAKEKVTNA